MFGHGDQFPRLKRAAKGDALIEHFQLAPIERRFYQNRHFALFGFWERPRGALQMSSIDQGTFGMA
jgi:hypothetical protein